MTFYEDFGNQMYWGTPFLRAGNYFQNKLYWNFLDNPNVNGQLPLKRMWQKEMYILNKC